MIIKIYKQKLCYFLFHSKAMIKLKKYLICGDKRAFLQQILHKTLNLFQIQSVRILYQLIFHIILSREILYISSLNNFC